MKLVYVYFDFTRNGIYPDGYRGFKEVELNFSTESNYKIVVQNGINYIMSERKTEDQKIESGFWGDSRIYNITAIVGNNGVGKTTLLHSLLRACLNNSGANFSYAILMATDAGEENKRLHLYSNMDCNFDGNGMIIERYNGYPVELKKTKFMLLSNTISLSDIELTNEYECDYKEYTVDDDIMPMNKEKKQFYNESLTSSMCYSGYISKEGRRQNTRDIVDQIATHFQYESFQEIRYVFDKYQRNTLKRLREQYYQVPMPKRLIMRVSSPESSFIDMCELLNIDEQEYADVFEKIAGGHYQSNRLSIVYILAMNCILSFMFADSYGEPAEEYLNELFSYADFNEEKFINFLKRYDGNCSIDEVEEDRKRCIAFIEFLSRNEKTFSTQFERFQEYTYSLEVKEENDSFMVEFLNKYRSICNFHYFLTFSWGLSSGESNLLRMFTKLRYLLSGPTSYDDLVDDREHEKNRIINWFKHGEDIVCDSLVVLIDEADLTYHPDWQRSFVSVLTTFLPQIYKDPYFEDDEYGCKNIQIILTTHSPLMLGDFPTGSVIYLKNVGGSVFVEKDKGINNFGQNLYTILKDGFFMKRSIGEFTHRKLCAVIKEINSINEKTEEYKTEKLDSYQRIINHLPRGIIREKLQQEIDECRRRFEGDDKQKRLMKKKEELLRQLQDINNCLLKIGEEE